MHAEDLDVEVIETPRREAEVIVTVTPPPEQDEVDIVDKTKRNYLADDVNLDEDAAPPTTSSTTRKTSMCKNSTGSDISSLLIEDNEDTPFLQEGDDLRCASALLMQKDHALPFQQVDGLTAHQAEVDEETLGPLVPLLIPQQEEEDLLTALPEGPTMPEEPPPPPLHVHLSKARSKTTTTSSHNITSSSTSGRLSEQRAESAGEGVQGSVSEDTDRFFGLFKEGRSDWDANRQGIMEAQLSMMGWTAAASSTSNRKNNTVVGKTNVGLGGAGGGGAAAGSASPQSSSKKNSKEDNTNTSSGSASGALKESNKDSSSPAKEKRGRKDSEASSRMADKFVMRVEEYDRPTKDEEAAGDGAVEAKKEKEASTSNALASTESTSTNKSASTTDAKDAKEKSSEENIASTTSSSGDADKKDKAAAAQPTSTTLEKTNSHPAVPASSGNNVDTADTRTSTGNSVVASNLSTALSVESEAAPDFQMPVRTVGQNASTSHGESGSGSGGSPIVLLPRAPTGDDREPTSSTSNSPHPRSGSSSSGKNKVWGSTSSTSSQQRDVVTSHTVLNVVGMRNAAKNGEEDEQDNNIDAASPQSPEQVQLLDRVDSGSAASPPHTRGRDPYNRSLDDVEDDDYRDKKSRDANNTSGGSDTSLLGANDRREKWSSGDRPEDESSSTFSEDDPTTDEERTSNLPPGQEANGEIPPLYHLYMRDPVFNPENSKALAATTAAAQPVGRKEPQSGYDRLTGLDFNNPVGANFERTKREQERVEKEKQEVGTMSLETMAELLDYGVSYQKWLKGRMDAASHDRDTAGRGQGAAADLLRGGAGQQLGVGPPSSTAAQQQQLLRQRQQLLAAARGAGAGSLMDLHQQQLIAAAAARGDPIALAALSAFPGGSKGATAVAPMLPAGKGTLHPRAAAAARLLQQQQQQQGAYAQFYPPPMQQGVSPGGAYARPGLAPGGATAGGPALRPFSPQEEAEKELQMLRKGRGGAQIVNVHKQHRMGLQVPQLAGGFHTGAGSRQNSASVSPRDRSRTPKGSERRRLGNPATTTVLHAGEVYTPTKAAQQVTPRTNVLPPPGLLGQATASSSSKLPEAGAASQPLPGASISASGAASSSTQSPSGRLAKTAAQMEAHLEPHMEPIARAPPQNQQQEKLRNLVMSERQRAEQMNGTVAGRAASAATSSAATTRPSPGMVKVGSSASSSSSSIQPPPVASSQQNPMTGPQQAHNGTSTTRAP
ncbi:unnamed protein product, partial [Amoebophrya sp. A25]|eukprot:GSA25T00015544001.1